MSKTHIALFRSKYARGLFLLGFSLIVLFSLLNQTPNLSAAIAPAQGIVTTSTRFFESSQPTTATKTVTTTSLSTVSVTTTTTTNPSASLSTTTQRLTETITTTSASTSTTGLDFPILVAVSIIALTIGAIIGALAVTIVNASRLIAPKPPLGSRGLLNGYCGRCDKPAQNNICTGCGLSTATCRCVMETPGCNVNASKSNSSF